MNYLNMLAKLAEERIARYGAQYNTFAIFGLINYPFAFLYKLLTHGYTEELWLRAIAFILCVILVLKDSWSNQFKRYLPLYWFFTIILLCPVFATYMMLKEQFSLGWLINFNIGIMIAILVLDALSFLVITILGIILGISLFYLLGNSVVGAPSTENLMLFVYMFLCIVVLGSIFTRNKEIFNHYIQKTKDDLNESLEKKVKERTKELEKALAAKTEFLNNMSHEMRTPISGFMTISEGLVENWNNLTNDKRKKYVNDISNSAKRLGSLISNILDLSTFISNKMYMNYTKFDFSDLIQEIIEETKILYATEKKIIINFNSEEEYYVMADKDWMSQTLRHLFSNTVKFSRDAVDIFVKLNKKESFLHFSIKDNGIGIPENEKNEIFAPFSQSSRTKTKAGGRGLGLAICKEIIEAHRGKIWAENNDAGATFHFVIPIKAEHNE